MKRTILLLSLPLLLASCESITPPNVSPTPEVDPLPSTPIEETPVIPEETPSEEDISGTDVNPPVEEEEKPVQEEEEKTDEDEDEKPIVQEEDDEQGLSLDEWKTWTFSDGDKPQYNKDWDFYYGTSFEPSGCLWENPKVEEYNGIEFEDKKHYLISPIFKSYPKVEVRFEFWFSSHTSGSYKADKNEPQFKIEEFDSKDNSVGVDTIEIEKSDIPKTNTTRQERIYLTNSKMTHFHLRFNNFIANGDSGYTAILYSVSLKGWPQV